MKYDYILYLAEAIFKTIPVLMYHSPTLIVPML